MGICGFGGFALNAAAMDIRIKATVTATMYDMCRVNANGYFDGADNADARYEMKKALNAQRSVDFVSGDYKRAGGVADPMPDGAPITLRTTMPITKQNEVMRNGRSIQTTVGM